mmetsp:Transcript_30213/g.64787  ORF Transcript_30213/g.64787 Transcript_30213/m.64787 type:complete len:208 (-) Transcript_30213:871-1494(-)
MAYSVAVGLLSDCLDIIARSIACHRAKVLDFEKTDFFFAPTSAVFLFLLLDPLAIPLLRFMRVPKLFVILARLALAAGERAIILHFFVGFTFGYFIAKFFILCPSDNFAGDVLRVPKSKVWIVHAISLVGSRCGACDGSWCDRCRCCRTHNGSRCVGFRAGITPAGVDGELIVHLSRPVPTCIVVDYPKEGSTIAGIRLCQPFHNLC